MINAPPLIRSRTSPRLALPDFHIHLEDWKPFAILITLQYRSRTIILGSDFRKGKRRAVLTYSRRGDGDKGTSARGKLRHEVAVAVASFGMRRVLDLPYLRRALARSRGDSFLPTFPVPTRFYIRKTLRGTQKPGIRTNGLSLPTGGNSHGWNEEITSFYFWTLFICDCETDDATP